MFPKIYPKCDFRVNTRVLIIAIFTPFKTLSCCYVRETFVMKHAQLKLRTLVTVMFLWRAEYGLNTFLPSPSAVGCIAFSGVRLYPSVTAHTRYPLQGHFTLLKCRLWSRAVSWRKSCPSFWNDRTKGTRPSTCRWLFFFIIALLRQTAASPIISPCENCVAYPFPSRFLLSDA